MNEKYNIEQESFLKKLKKAIVFLPPEKAFYTGIFFILSLIFLFLSIAFYLKTKTISVPKYNTTLNIGILGEVRYLTPTYASFEAEKIISGLLYAGLLKKDENGNYINDLAEKIEKNSEATEVKITIKEKAKFANGEDITSYDVLFTYQLLADPLVKHPEKIRFEGFDFQIIDNKNLIISFKRPYPIIDEVLTTGILSKKEYENIPLENIVISNLNQDSISSGIYQIKNKIIDNKNRIKKLELVSNADYVNKRPFIKYLNIKFYENKDTLIKDYEKEKIDLIFGIKEKDILEKNSNLKNKYIVHTYSLPRITAIFLNPNKNETYAKRENREKIYKSINRDIFSNFGISNYSFLPTSIKENRDTIMPNSPLSIILTLSDNEDSIEIANLLKTNLYKQNIEVILNPKPLNEIVQNIIRNRDYTALLYTIEIPTTFDLYPFWHSSQRNSPGLNLAVYASKNLDQNLENIRKTNNIQNTTEYIENIKKEFDTEYPYIPLFTPQNEIIYRNNLKLTLPKQIISPKDLIQTINFWYNQEEKVLNIMHSQNFIDKIYKLIH